MSDTNDIKTKDPEGMTQPVKDAAAQAENNVKNISNNSNNIINNISDLPKNIAKGLTETYNTMATPYRQNLSTDTTDLTNLNNQTEIETRLSAAEAVEAAPQMFENFINKNYTEDQQQQIRDEISAKLAENNGTCTITWKDKEEKDALSAEYEQNKLKKFKLYNEDITEDNYTRQELRFHMKNDAYTLIAKSKDKSHIATGQITNTSKDKIKVKKDGSYKSSSSDQDKLVTSGFGQVSVSGTKQKATERGDESGIKSKSQSVSQYNIEAGMFAIGAGVRKAKKQTTFDDNGNIIKQTVGANGVAVSTHGLDVAHMDKKTTYNEDGTSVTIKNELHAALSAQHLAANAQIAHQKTVAEANGTILSDTKLMAEANVGYGTIGGSIETNTLRRDENGTEISQHNAISGNVSQHGIAAGFVHDSKMVDNTGTTLYQNNTSASLMASSAGAAFKASQLKDVRDESGKTLLHKELSAQADFRTDGKLNINLTSQIQTETEKKEKAFIAAVDKSNLSASATLTTAKNGEETEKFTASADVKSAKANYNDKKISPEILLAQTMRQR